MEHVAYSEKPTQYIIPAMVINTLIFIFLINLPTGIAATIATNVAKVLLNEISVIEKPKVSANRLKVTGKLLAAMPGVDVGKGFGEGRTVCVYPTRNRLCGAVFS